jgi:hypothetical protein
MNQRSYLNIAYLISNTGHHVKQNNAYDPQTHRHEQRHRNLGNGLQTPRIRGPRPRSISLLADFDRQLMSDHNAVSSLYFARSLHNPPYRVPYIQSYRALSSFINCNTSRN